MPYLLGLYSPCRHLNFEHELGGVNNRHLPSICHQNYFQTSKDHLTWIIWKVNRMPTHCGVAYERVCSLAGGHVIRVCHRHMGTILKQ